MAERPIGKRRVMSDDADAQDSAPPVSEADGATEADGAAQPEADGATEADGAAQPEADAEPAEPEPFDAEAALARTALPPRAESWRKRSATGAILTGFALGLQQVFEPERKEPAIVMETSGEPPTDLPVEAELEMATTRRSVVRIRPWLLDENGEPLEMQDEGDVLAVDDDAHPAGASEAGGSTEPGGAPRTAIAPRARQPRRLRKRKR